MAAPTKNDDDGRIAVDIYIPPELFEEAISLGVFTDDESAQEWITDMMLRALKEVKKHPEMRPPPDKIPSLDVWITREIQKAVEDKKQQLTGMHR